MVICDIMVINYRIAWDIKKKEFLNKYNIKTSYTFNIFMVEFTDNTKNYADILNYANDNNYCIIENVIFDNDEINSADWFLIDSVWTNLYPFPRDNFKYLEKTYDLTSYCKGNEPKYFCRIGKIQNNNFVLDKDPRWATRNIMRLNLIAEELFVSKKCVDKLIESDLNGFSFKQVFKKIIFQMKYINCI